VAKTVRIEARGFGRYYEYDKNGKHIGTVTGGRAKAEKRAAELGIKIEPLSSQFKKGQSGNPGGRPTDAAVEADKRLVALTEERDELMEKVGQLRQWWADSEKERKAANERRDAYQLQAETDRQQRVEADQRLAAMVAERDTARSYIEGLLDGMHPQRPQLPWESRYERIQSVGNVSFEERYR
jgi:chromosome segregation ATPase